MTEGQEKPKRIQRRRVKGWKMPPNTIYAGRPSLLGNPFKVEDWGPEGAVEAFRLYLTYHHAGKAMVSFLRTQPKRNLACWCRLDRPCHVDVLLEFAYGEIANG